MNPDALLIHPSHLMCSQQVQSVHSGQDRDYTGSLDLVRCWEFYIQASSKVMSLTVSLDIRRKGDKYSFQLLLPRPTFPLVGNKWVYYFAAFL